MSSSVQGPFGIVATQAIYDTNLSPAEFRVLAALASFAGKGKFGEWCAPKQTELADKLGLSRPTVSMAVKRLVELGYLITRAQITSGGGKTGLEYYVRRDFQDDDPMSAKSNTGSGENEETLGKPPMLAKADVSKIEQPMSAKSNIPPFIEKNLSNTLAASAKRPASVFKKSNEPSEAFMALWAAWRAKDSIGRSVRKASWEAYSILVRDGASEDEIARGVRAFLSDSRQTKDGGQFMKAFAVWLKNEAWADWAEKAPPTKPAGPPSTNDLWAPRYHEWLKTDGLIWDYKLWGPAPNEPGHKGPKRFRENGKVHEQGVAA